MDLEEPVSAYLELRAERERLLRKYEEEDTAIKLQMTELETFLLDTCNKINANSINTPVGTVIRSIKDRAVCNDWDNFRKFVMEHDALELLERRIHQGNFRQFMEEHMDDGLPPGVNVMREFGITVRKPSSQKQ